MSNTTRPTDGPAPIHEMLPGHLAQGYKAFRNGRLPHDLGRFRDLAEFGQKPLVLLIGCCDSRVAPEVIFDAGPGEIFVVRNIAALVPPFAKSSHYQETSAAIEYAVLALNVAHIVVMGHAQCGGIRAYAQGEAAKFQPLSDADFVSTWKQLIKPAYDRLGPNVGAFDDFCETLSHASIIQGLANLRSYPWVEERVREGKLTLHGAYFGVADGGLSVLDQDKGSFVPAMGSRA